MKNRDLREFYYVGYNKKLILNINSITIDNINKYKEILGIFSRYNKIKENKRIREISKTHTVVAKYNHIGSYEGYFWKRNK